MSTAVPVLVCLSHFPLRHLHGHEDVGFHSVMVSILCIQPVICSYILISTIV